MGVSASPTDSASAELWRVQLLGSFRADRAGHPATFRTKKTASLLAYLVYHAGRRVSKEFLVEALWPESDSEKGRHSLRVALSSLRATFEAEGWDPAAYLWSDRDSVEASERGFTTDVREFQELIARARRVEAPEEKASYLRDAVALYSGSFLPSFGDAWILPQALELEELYAQAAGELIELTARLGDLPQAVMIGRKAIGLCPNREDLHVSLMRAYAAAGQTSQAMKQYEELERMLDDMWGEMPGEDALSVLESLPRRTAAPAASVEVSMPLPDLQPPKTSFFGRDREVAELRQVLGPEASGPRLVTLCGLGGTGKTRLALRCRQDLFEDYAGRAWFSSLVGLEELPQLYDALISALAVPPSESDPLGALTQGIGKAPAVLIMDNLEQIVPAARTAIRGLLSACPGLRVLATSRIPLDIEGERISPVLPLQMPADFRDLNALRENPSVQLLVEAAQSVRPGFAVTPANAQSILLLTLRLEGIPLAIELAAAKLGALTPAQVIASIGRRIDLSSAKAPVREEHRSLRTIIEWSLGLLTEAEREAFAILGICRGGFNISLALALAGAEAEEHVQRLCRCSLLTWVETAEEVRFEMLETVREMASQLLESQPELLEKADQAHFEFIYDLCRRFSDSDWIASMTADVGNILVAFETATAGRVDPVRAWEMALPIEKYIDRRGRVQIWVAPIEALLAATKEKLDPLMKARAHAFMAYAYYALRRIRATFDEYQHAIAAADQTDDRALQIRTRTDSVSSAITLGDFDYSQRTLEEATARLAEIDDPRTASHCYLNLAWVVFDRGNEENSGPVFEEAVSLAERSGDRAALAAALTGLACGVGHMNYEEAQPIFDRAQRLWEESELPSRLAHYYYYRALIDYRHDRLDVAFDNVRRSLTMYVENGTALGQSSLTITGNIFAARGLYEAAAICWGRADSARRAHNMLIIPCLGRDYDAELAKAKAADLESAWTRSQGLTDRAFYDLIFA